MAPLLSEFHDAAFPLHTHPTCDCCKQMRRCAGPDGSMKLSRCKECQIARYCSRECQVDAWKHGHKEECKKDFQRKRNNATLSSGNPQAWAEFAQWREYHHDSLTNAALSHYIMDGPGPEADYILHVIISYQNNPELPVERKFNFQGCCFVHKDKTASDNQHPTIPFIPPVDTMWGLLMLRHLVRTRNPMLPVFYRIFAFADEHLKANVNQQVLPAHILEKIFRKGRKQRFCCGKLPGIPTCCCGGWTHEKRNTANDYDSDEDLDAGQSSLQFIPATT
ncbi:hypothetical protein PENSPDRAFT_671741 [Peniophora sp. CONT]|nr:hypothetical protein PENSPDRAFT_671741 [Peniophora sp. CONT]